MKHINNKRPAAVTLCLVILVMLLTPAAPALATRVPSNWAAAEVNDANTTGLLSASAARDFQAYLTRDEFCEIVVAMAEQTLGRPLPVPSNNPFYDCSSVYVLKAWQYGVVTGVTSTQFDPDSYVERQQLCVMMIRAIRLLERDLGKTLLSPATQTLSYNDTGRIAGYALDSVKLAHSNSIMIGDDRNYFNPQSPISSEECVIAVLRSYNRTERLLSGGMSTSQLLDLAEKRVHIGYAYGETADGVSQALILPTTSTGGSTVTWTSSNNSVISSSGAVYPGYSAQTVTLTATIRLSGQTRTKTFTVRTSQYTGDQLLMENAYSALNVVYVNAGDNADSVTGRIALPGKVLGLPVTWSSSNPGVVSASGIVNVPGGSETYPVTLTAVITNGYMTKVKTFNLTVLNPAFGRGVTLHRVGFGMSQQQVASLIGTPVRAIQAGSNEVWRLYHNNYSSFIAVAFSDDSVTAVYSMASGVANQLRNSSGSVISVSQANSVGGVGATSYTDSSQQYAILIYDRSSGIGSARALFAEGQEQILYELINAFRVRSGRTALQWSDRLGKPSRDHSDEMGQYNYLSTTSRNGRTLQQRAADEGFDRNRFTSGNVLAGENDAIAFFQKMLATTTMRSNIVAAGVTIFGAGFSGGHSGTYRNYFTYMFGSLTEISWITATQQGSTASIITVSPGSTATVILTISPTGYNESFTVTSSNPRVITVMSSGTTVYVTGVNSGDADIVITCGSSGNLFTIPVIVDTVYATSLSLSYGTYPLTNSYYSETSNTKLVLGTLDSLTIAASSGISGAVVNWTVDNGNIATVNDRGVVTAGYSAGTVTVSATVEVSPYTTLTHSVVVNVIDHPIVTIDAGALDSTGKTAPVSTTARVNYFRDITDADSYAWTSGNTSAATVGTLIPTDSGSAVIVTGIYKGTSSMTAAIRFTATWNTSAKRGAVSAAVNVTVIAGTVEPASIMIKDEHGAEVTGPLTVTLSGSSEALDLFAVVLPANADYKEILWSFDCSTPGVAYTIQDGDRCTVVCMIPGSVTVTVKSVAKPGVYAYVVIDVTGP